MQLNIYVDQMVVDLYYALSILFKAFSGIYLILSADWVVIFYIKTADFTNIITDASAYLTAKSLTGEWLLSAG